MSGKNKSVRAHILLDNLAEEFSIFANRKIYVACGAINIASSPFDEEQSLINQAVPSRKMEFYSGRHYARQALQYANVAPAPILRGNKGDPLWPQNISGSITHDANFAIAVVMRGMDKTIGVDFIKNPETVEATLQPLIASENDLRAIELMGIEISSLALVFSLKESVVKAVSPGIDHYLDLLDIHLHYSEGRLTACLPRLNKHLACEIFLLSEGFVTLAILNV